MALLSTLRIAAAFGIAVLAHSEDRLIFEVASVKPANPDARGTSINFVPGGGLKVTNATLKTLITFAYDIRGFQVSGGPGWLDSERYDLLAKPEHAEGPAQLKEMTDAQQKTAAERIRERLRMLLAERFRLAIHRESKEVPVYALTIGKNGSKLEESKEPDGANQSMSTNMNNGKAQMTARRIPMQHLANVLSGQLSRPVLDRTGLMGKYNFKMDWSADMSARGPDAAADANAADPSGPSIFTAVQEQLGLRLESTKGPVEIIVIDSAEKASEN